uniref:t-SNARE coiled-coil homology domain-containing protein n=1 Tax=Globodera pallida TaxID=36090 RepID=A0A183BPC8_GLOPA
MAYRSSPHAGTSNGGAGGGFLVEQQNDDMVEELSSKVSQLKRVTIAIGDDVREQNKLLNEMETKFDSTRGLLGATMKKLGIVSKAGGKNVMCYLVLFAFFVFLVIYWMMR